MKSFSGVQRKLSSLSTGWLERRRSKQPKTSQRLNSKGKALLGELLHRFFSLSQRSRWLWGTGTGTGEESNDCGNIFFISITENCCIEPVFKRIWLITCCAVKVPCIWHDDEQLICNGVWWDLILFYGFYDVTPYKRGMISWTPLGKDICPYGGRDDELVTTEHPRDTEGSEDIMYAGNTSRALCGCNCTCGTQSTLGCKWGRQRSTLRFYPRHGWKLKQEPPGLILVKSIFSI